MSHLDHPTMQFHFAGQITKIRELVEANTMKTANRQKQSHSGNEFLTLQVGHKVLFYSTTHKLRAQLVMSETCCHCFCLLAASIAEYWNHVGLDPG